MNIHYLRFVCEAISRIWRTKRIASNSAIVVFACLLANSSYATSLYKSVGPNGEIIYSARPPVNAKVEKTLSFKELPRSAVPASKPDTTKPVELPSDNVVLYMADWCGYCRKAKAYLASKNIAYREINIDSEYGKNAFAQVSSEPGIPLLFANGQRVQGYTMAAYDELFGY
jgi:glutaredoxin